MLNTLLIPTSGSARVCGFDVVSQTREVRRRIGYVFGGDRGLYDRLSALDNLRYFAELYGVPVARQKHRIGELLELVGLTGRERVEGYSRGMRQRLHIARGRLHEPEVLFLDEPSIGVDPVAARELRNTVAGLAATGTTVLLTTGTGPVWPSLGICLAISAGCLAAGAVVMSYVEHRARANATLALA